MENTTKIRGMMPLFTGLLLAIGTLLSKKAPAQPLSSTLRQQAYQAVQASILKDYKTVLTYTYPRVINLMGGPKKMLALLEQHPHAGPSQPIHILIKQPGPIYPAGKELHTLVPYVVTIPQKQKWIKLSGYQLGVSMNQGKHWYFVPTDQLTQAAIHTLFPVFNPQLKIPPASKPVLLDQP